MFLYMRGVLYATEQNDETLEMPMTDVEAEKFLRYLLQYLSDYKPVEIGDASIINLFEYCGKEVAYRVVHFGIEFLEFRVDFNTVLMPMNVDLIRNITKVHDGLADRLKWKYGE